MKKYKVNVNGTDYEITVELLDETACATTQLVPPSASPNPNPLQPSSLSAVKISSPMPGTILNVSCATGQVVKKGDKLMVLEAMKMENEILAPQDGKIISLHTAKGATVESGTLLCELQ